MPLGKRVIPLSTFQTQGSTPQENEAAHTAPPSIQPSLTDANQNTESSFFQAEEPQYGFDDIILNQSVYNAIQDVLALYEKQDLLFRQWGLGERQKNKNRAGINLYGHSGTGKSMAAHAIAKQLNRKILTVDYSQIESKYVGETSKNLVAVFHYAKETQSVIFFDEADALLSRRVTNMSNSTDVSVNQTRSVLLVLLNEYDVLILFASNFISNYDPAFLRRILAHVNFELPDEENRFKLWRMYIPAALPTDVDISALAKKYSGISGSNIASAVLNASLRTARSNEVLVKQEYFEEAIENIIKSKAANENLGELTSKRIVSEDYVKSQFKGDLPK